MGEVVETRCPSCPSSSALWPFSPQSALYGISTKATHQQTSSLTWCRLAPSLSVPYNTVDAQSAQHRPRSGSRASRRAKLTRLSTPSSTSRVQYIRCSGASLLAQDSIKKSAYRTFLRSSMKCAGAAFQASGEVFPSEGMAMDVLEMMSVDWLASTMLTMELAGKYKPAISALPNNGNRIFQECMAKLEKVPGSPAASNKIKSPRRRMEAEQNSVGFTDVVADVAGINELPKPPARSGVEGGVPQKGGPNRRLMKGFFFFFFFNTFGDASYSGSCFGDDGIVTNALTQQPMQMRDVGLHDRLVTTVPDDEVWFMHSSSKPTDTTRLVTSTGSAIELTPAHMIMTSTGMKQAGEVQVGDSLVKQNGELSEVVRKEAGKVSVTAPITMSGTIVVDGVVASCYAYGNHQVMHTALAPFRLLYSLSPEMAMFIAQSGLAVMSAMPESVLANHMSQVLVASVLFALALPVSAAYLTGSKALRRGQAVTA